MFPAQSNLETGLVFVPAVHRNPVPVRDPGQPELRGCDAMAGLSTPHPNAASFD